MKNVTYYCNLSWKNLIIVAFCIQILKSSADKYMSEIHVDDGHPRPFCNLLLQWIGEHGSRVTPLTHPVMILGTTDHNTFFTIVHYPKAINDGFNQPLPNRHPVVRKYG